MPEADYYIKLLANKIKAYADRSNKTDRSNHRLRIADVTHNLSAVIYGIVNSLYREPLPVNDIESLIDDHNRQHGTTNTLKIFLDNGWLRVINSKYFIPSVVSSYMDEVIQGKYKGWIAPHGPDLQQIDCLIQIESAIASNYSYTLTEAEVKKIIKEKNSKITVKELIELCVLSQDKDGKLLYVFSGPSDPDIDDRVLAMAWFNIVGNTTDVEKFGHFFRFAQLSNCWPRGLSYYASHEQINAMVTFAIDRLTNETDLSAPEIEVRNDKYDSYRFAMRTGLPDIPDYGFSKTRPYNFLMELRNFRSYDRDLFTFRENDSFYGILIRMLIHYDKASEDYRLIRDLIKTSPNPYIRNKVVQTVKMDSPEILAHFLKDHDLAAVAFYYLDSMAVHENWIVSELGYDVSTDMSDEIKKKIWIEAFDLYMKIASHSFNIRDFASPIAEILHQTAENTFNFNTLNYRRSVDQHQIYRERYEYVIKKLGTVRLQQSSYHYGEQLPLLIGVILPEVYRSLSGITSTTQVNDLMVFESAWVDIRVELLKYLQNDFSNDQLYGREDNSLEKLPDGLLDEIHLYLLWYFNAKDFNVYSFIRKPELTKVHRHGDFGLEIIDWPVLFSLLEERGELDDLEKAISASISIDRNDNSRRNDDNTEELFKVSIYVKILLSAYLSLKHQQSRGTLNSNIALRTTATLEKLIIDHTLKFNKDDAPNGRLDLFSNRNFFYQEGPYSYSMISRLYRAVNYFSSDTMIDFVVRFFSDNDSYDKLLRAYNRVDNLKVKEVISERIKAQSDVQFINNSSYAEIQAVLAEIANSDSLYQLAVPFLMVLEARAEKKGEFQIDLKRSLFSIKLLLALKGKKFDELKALEPPPSPFNTNRPEEKDLLEKEYYLALYYSDNDQNYTESTNILAALTQKEPANVKFAFNLYRVRTLNGEAELAKEEWDKFQKDHREALEAERVSYDDLSRSLAIMHYIGKKEWILFDQAINTLSATFLYQDFLIIAVYHAYQERDMSEAAFLFIQEGVAYLNANKLTVSAELLALERSSFDDKQLRKIGTALLGLRSMPHDKIPLIAPPLLNDQRNFQDFVLKEFFQAAKIMREKIKAVESIKHEDNFNDVLLAILRMRIPFWGWEATDQSRSGNSASRKSAGEVDLLIQGGGQSLALVEALKLAGSNITTLQPHVLKCAGYNKDLDFFIIISYFIGNRTSWPGFKDIYIQDIKDITYPADQALNISAGIKELTNNFKGLNGMEILISIHGDNDRKLLHLLIDVSKEPKLPAVPKRPKAKKATKSP